MHIRTFYVCCFVSVFLPPQLLLQLVNCCCFGAGGGGCCCFCCCSVCQRWRRRFAVFAMQRGSKECIEYDFFLVLNLIFH